MSMEILQEELTKLTNKNVLESSNDILASTYVQMYAIADDLKKSMDSLKKEILKRENSAEVQTATWFMRKKEFACPQDVSLREEDDYIDLVKNGGFDIIFADACMEKMVPDFQGIFVNTRHFAVSGRLCE